MQEVTYESVEAEFSLPGSIRQMLEETRDQEIVLTVPIGGVYDAYK